jgi:hypothetical protein
LESWPTEKPQCPYERTIELIQIHGLRQTRRSFYDIDLVAGKTLPSSWIVASKRAQVSLSERDSSKPVGIARSSRAAAVSEGQPEKLHGNSTVPADSRDIRSASGINQGYQRGRLCGASDPFRPGSADPQEGFGELKKPSDRAGNLTRPWIIFDRFCHPGPPATRSCPSRIISAP